MLTLFAVLILGLMVAVVAAVVWRGTCDVRGDASEWFEDRLRPIFAPAVVLPVARLQRRVVTTVLSQVELTSSGRGVLRSPALLLFSPGDYGRLESVRPLIASELAEDLVARAKQSGWEVQHDFVVELACDPGIADGRPRAEIGRPFRDSIRVASAAYDPTTSPVDHVPTTPLFDLAPTTPETTKTRPLKTMLHSVSSLGADETEAYEEPVSEQFVGLDGAVTLDVDATSACVSIGRTAADVVAAHPEVSRRHAALRHEGDGTVTLSDESSRNGTFVNGERISTKTLLNGDEVRFSPGGPRFVFWRLAPGKEA